MGDMADFINDQRFDDDEYSNRQELISLRFLRVRAETRAAWLIEFELGADLESVEEWMPKSQCAMPHTPTPNIDGVIYAPMWLIEEKCLECYKF